MDERNVACAQTCSARQRSASTRFLCRTARMPRGAVQVGLSLGMERWSPDHYDRVEWMEVGSRRVQKRLRSRSEQGCRTLRLRPRRRARGCGRSPGVRESTSTAVRPRTFTTIEWAGRAPWSKAKQRQGRWSASTTYAIEPVEGRRDQPSHLPPWASGGSQRLVQGTTTRRILSRSPKMV